MRLAVALLAARFLRQETTLSPVRREFHASGGYHRVDGEEDALSRDMSSVAVSDESSEPVGPRRHRLTKRELHIYRRVMASGDESEVRRRGSAIRYPVRSAWRHGEEEPCHSHAAVSPYNAQNFMCAPLHTVKGKDAVWCADS